MTGFSFGAIVYGIVLSLMQVLYNGLGSTRDALITLVVCALLYGLWAAAFFLGAWVLVRLLALLRRRGDGGGEEVRRRSVRLGLFVFNFVFWAAFFLYGLTYEEVPIGHPSSPAGMLTYVAGVALLVALGSALASWLLERLFEALRWRRWLVPVVAGIFLLAVVVHAAAPLYAGQPPGKAETKLAKSGPKPRIERVDNGLKVVLVGFDGADWRVIRPLLAKGELPTFAGMMRQGAAGPLATIYDSNSAVIWASIYTGTPPDRHGILDFYHIELPGMGSAGLYPVHRSYFKELADIAGRFGLIHQAIVTRFDLRTLPVWEIADHAGLTVGVVDGYLYSVPAMKTTRPEGFFLSYGLDGFAQQEGGKSMKDAAVFAQPPQLFRQVRPWLGRDDFYWEQASLFEMLRTHGQPEFLNFYTHEPDSYQHWYWKWLQPQYFLGVTREGLAKNGDRIPSIYRGFDAFLRRLRATVGPDTVVIVASDHGHAPTMLHGRFYSQHRHGPPGILLMLGGPVRRGLVLQEKDIYDLFPTVLYLLGLPVPQDVPGQVMLDALDPAFVRDHPVRTVPTYETLGPAKGLPAAVGRGESMNRKEIEKLKSLGYL